MLLSPFWENRQPHSIGFLLKIERFHLCYSKFRTRNSKYKKGLGKAAPSGVPMKL